MPPRKTKASKVPSLQGCAITFGASSIPGDAIKGKNLSDLKTEISQVGGEYVTKVSACTHLVVTENQYNKSGAKVNEAKTNSDVKIVSFDWLEGALSSTGPLDTALYELHKQTNSGSSATANGTKKSPKGTAKDEDDDDNSTAPASKKRKRGSDDTVKDEPGTKKTQGNGKALNVTKKKDLNIPLDEALTSQHGSSWKVYIDDDSNIYDVTLNQSDSGANANKFYRLQLVQNTATQNWNVWSRWGRVSELGQFKLLGSGDFDDAMGEFEKKFKDKTGNKWEDRATGPMRPKKYVFIERSYEDSDSEGENDLPGAEKRTKVKKEEDGEEEVIESKLTEPVQRLLKLIFNQDYFNNAYADYDYDAKKMPLGKLSKNSLMRGYEVLKELSAKVGGPDYHDEIVTLSNQYLSLIPHVIRRSERPPVLDTMDKVKKEIELLEALTDMQLANNLMKNAKKGSKEAEEISLLDRQFAGLGMQEMTPLAQSSAEFRDLSEYLTNSVGYTHGTRYKVQDIFRIERDGEHARFDGSSYAKIKNKNRRLLWHGSRATNFGGILSQGLRIAPPEAPATGYMFGKGVYLADMSSKSANYCCSHSSGGTGLLLLCEAELGDPPLKLTNADYNAEDRVKAANALSTWGVGRTAPQAWKDAGAVHETLKGVNMPDVVSVAPGNTNEAGAYLQYNEYIVYDVAQIKLRYLFRVSM